jgi:hypothetical protein
MSQATAPEWACRVFCDRANLNYEAVLVSSGDHGVVLRSAVKAGALLIAAHEDPPADPLFEEAQKIADFNRINLSAQPRVEDALLRALRRGMELAKQEPTP